MDKAEAKKILKNTGYIGNEVGVAFDVAIKSMDKLEKIEHIVDEWKESVEWDIEMHDTLEEIQKILEQE